MIEIKHQFSRQRVFANNVFLLDLIIPATYQHFKGGFIPPFYGKVVKTTNVVDLTQSMDEIFAHMKSNTRNEVRRAEREGVYCEFTEDVSDFIPFYNSFAKEKGLGLLTLGSLSQYGTICVGIAKDGDVILSMHATAFDPELKIALLLYSCSSRLDNDVDKKKIGWGNRLLHYKEFDHFKQMGMVEYDWNGVCVDPKQLEKYNIGLFKRSFGGYDKNNIWLESHLYRIVKILKRIMAIWGK